jgi:hypothetical protein
LPVDEHETLLLFLYTKGIGSQNVVRNAESDQLLDVLDNVGALQLLTTIFKKGEKARPREHKI